MFSFIFMMFQERSAAVLGAQGLGCQMLSARYHIFNTLNGLLHSLGHDMPISCLGLFRTCSPGQDSGHAWAICGASNELRWQEQILRGTAQCRALRTQHEKLNEGSC